MVSPVRCEREVRDVKINWFVQIQVTVLAQQEIAGAEDMQLCRCERQGSPAPRRDL